MLVSKWSQRSVCSSKNGKRTVFVNRQSKQNSKLLGRYGLFRLRIGVVTSKAPAAWRMQWRQSIGFSIKFWFFAGNNFAPHGHGSPKDAFLMEVPQVFRIPEFGGFQEIDVIAGLIVQREENSRYRIFALKIYLYLILQFNRIQEWGKKTRISHFRYKKTWIIV